MANFTTFIKNIDGIMIACFIMTIILVKIINQKMVYSREDKFFLWLITFILVNIILEIILYFIANNPAPLILLINKIINHVIYILPTLITYTWLIYVAMLMKMDEKRLAKFRILSLIPILFNAILVLCNPIKNWYFTINENGVYQRQYLFYILSLLCFVYLFWSFFLYIINRKSVPKNYFLTMISFLFLPLIGGIIHSIFLGTYALWISISLAVLIVFLNIQSAMLQTDYLTGLNNRMFFEKFLKYKIKNKAQNFWGYMIDIDNFKKINDTYGHSTGDQALIETAQILQEVFHRRTIIARYGGDEFIVLVLEENSDIYSSLLQKTVNQSNNNATRPYLLSFSTGVLKFNNEDMNMDQFLRKLDLAMYDVKHSKKFKRRAGDR